MNSTRDRSLSRHQRLYRTLLLAYPRAFRQVYGADMAQVFGDRLRAEHQRRGRRATFRVWLLTLLDLCKTAPLQRMEKKMTREAVFAILFGIALAFTAGTALMGTGTGIPMLGILVMLIAVAGFGLSGAFKRDRSSRPRGAGRLGLRDWWVVLAALAGLLQIGGMATNAIRQPTKENLFGAALVGLFGALLLGGAWYRTRSRAAGDWMIVIGILPFFGLWWMIWPTVLGLTIMISALLDSVRRTPASAPSPQNGGVEQTT